MPKTFIECQDQYVPVFGQILTTLDGSMGPEEIMVWMNRPHPDLTWRKPIELVNEGAGLKIRSLAFDAVAERRAA